MSLPFKLAVAATSIGFLTAAIALARTTPLTMLAFFWIGLTGFGAGFALYAYAVLRELRSKRVL